MASVLAGLLLTSTTTASAASTVQNIRQTGSTANSITVAWDQYPGAVRYRVYASPSASMPYYCEPHCTIITPASSSSPSHTITGLSAGTTRYVKISAINSAGKTISSWQTSGVTTTTSGATPTTVQNIRQTDSTTSSITVAWDQYPGAVRYRVYATPTSSMPSKCEPHCTVITPSSSSSPSHTITGLSAGTTRYVKISAINSAGKTISSWQSAGLKTSAQVAPPAPTTVQNIRQTDSTANSITVAWDQYPGAVRYRVYAAPTADMPYYCEPWCTVITPASSSSPSHTITGLSAGATRHIKISAIGSNGKTISSWQSAGVPTSAGAATPAPNTVQNIRTDAVGDTGFRVMWDPYPAAARYRLYISPTAIMPGTCEPHCSVITPTDLSSPAHTVANLSPGSAHYIKISAIGSNGKTISSWQSEPVEVQLTGESSPITDVPTGLRAASTSHASIQVLWDRNPDVPMYRIQLATKPDMSDAVYYRFTHSPATMGKLQPDTTYYLRIRTITTNGDNLSPYTGTSLVVKTDSPRSDLAVASFNVKCFNCVSAPGVRLPTELDWYDRRDVVAQSIVSRMPDVIGIQEASQAWLYEGGQQVNKSQFEDLLNRVKAVGGTSFSITNPHRNNCVKSTTPTNCVYRDQGASKGTKIFYNSATVTMLSQGSKMLEKIGSQERYVAWATFRRASNGEEFLFATTHLEPGTAHYALRLRQSQELVAELNRVNTKNLPVILAGDFNSTRYAEPTNAPYDEFIRSGLVDPLGHTYKSPKVSSLATAERRINAHYNSFGNFSPIQRKYGTNENGSNLDYILTSPMRTTEWETVVNEGPDDELVGVIPSDHNMLVARVILP